MFTTVCITAEGGLFNCISRWRQHVPPSHGSLVHPSPDPNWHLDWFRHFAGFICVTNTLRQINGPHYIKTYLGIVHY